MWKTVAKWLIAVVAVVAMVAIIVWNIDNYEAVDRLHKRGLAPAEDFGPPAVVPRSSKGSGDIDVWKPVE